MKEERLDYQIAQDVLTRSMRIANSRFFGSEELRIAIQRKGRLTELSWKLLEETMKMAGIKPVTKEMRKTEPRKLVFSSPDSPMVQVIGVGSADTPWYVASQNAKFGIVGYDRVLEYKLGQGSRLQSLRLGGTRCSLVIATRNDASILETRDLKGKKIATSYPNIVKGYLAAQNIAPEEIQFRKSDAETAAIIRAADAVCELKESGKTLRVNGLREIETVLSDIQPVLIAR